MSKTVGYVYHDTGGPNLDNIEGPVVPLERNLHGHTFAGLLWERQFGNHPASGKKYHFCLSSSINSSWEALNVKARSPDKFMDVSDMQVSNEDGYMTSNLTVRANSKIVNVRIWINLVTSKIVFQPLHSDTDMSKNPINGVETIVRDGRGFNMTLDAHSFKLVYQKTSLSTDDFYNHPEKITDVYHTEVLHDERIIAVREEPNLHIVFYQRDVPDGIWTPWKLLVDASRCRVNEFAMNMAPTVSTSSSTAESGCVEPRDTQGTLSKRLLKHRETRRKRIQSRRTVEFSRMVKRCISGWSYEETRRDRRRLGTPKFP